MNSTTAESPPASLTNATLAEIADVLREHQSFVVLSHVRPDGDALGSQLSNGSTRRKPEDRRGFVWWSRSRLRHVKQRERISRVSSFLQQYAVVVMFSVCHTEKGMIGGLFKSTSILSLCAAAGLMMGGVSLPRGWVQHVSLGRGFSGCSE